MENNKLPTIVITGGSGLIGSTIVSLFKDKSFNLVTPTKKQLNILDKKSVTKFLKQANPDVLINFASFTNTKKAQSQKGNKIASAWKTNVEGISNIAKTCKKLNIFLIHISSDGVFPGTQDFPGPYSEKIIPPNSPKKLSWYGYTKLIGDKNILKAKVKSAIIRISYPFGNLKSPKDFSVKVEKYIKGGYKLFSDQYLTPTYIPDLYVAIVEIINKKSTGIFHVACQEITAPYNFALYLSRKKGLNKHKVKKESLENYLIKKGLIISKFGGLKTNITQRKLGVKFHNWQKAIDELYA